MYPIGKQALQSLPLQYPILMIDTEYFGDDRSLLHTLFDHASAETSLPKLWFKLLDTGHQNFTEFSFFFPKILSIAKMTGKMDPGKAMLIITNTTLRFLQTMVNNSAVTLSQLDNEGSNGSGSDNNSSNNNSSNNDRKTSKKELSINNIIEKSELKHVVFIRK